MANAEKNVAYLQALRKPFVKLCRLRFLNPDGSTAFSLDNNPGNTRSGAFFSFGRDHQCQFAERAAAERHGDDLQRGRGL